MRFFCSISIYYVCTYDSNGHLSSFHLDHGKVNWWPVHCTRTLLNITANCREKLIFSRAIRAWRYWKRHSEREKFENWSKTWSRENFKNIRCFYILHDSQVNPSCSRVSELKKTFLIRPKATRKPEILNEDFLWSSQRNSILV